MASSTTVWTFNIGGTEIAIVEVRRNLGALRWWTQWDPQLSSSGQTATTLNVRSWMILGNRQEQCTPYSTAMTLHRQTLMYTDMHDNVAVDSSYMRLESNEEFLGRGLEWSTSTALAASFSSIFVLDWWNSWWGFLGGRFLLRASPTTLALPNWYLISSWID